MRPRRVAALVVLLVTACSLGGTPKATAPPSKSSIVSWLQRLDRDGVDFSITTRAPGAPVAQLTATGHLKDGEIDVTAGSAHLVVFDGVLYGAPVGSSKWLEMRADPVNFLWPAARLSLVWESLLLSRSSASPFVLPHDQDLVLAGALKATRGDVRIPASLGRVEVALDTSDSVWTPGAADAAGVQPPAAATPGNVLNLLGAGTPA